MNRVAYQDPAVSHVVTLLQDNCATIRDEYNAAASTLPSDYQSDTEHTTLHDGTWDWHSYMRKGMVSSSADGSNDEATPPFGQHFPQTASVLQQLRDDKLLFEGTPFGYTFFSTLHAQSRIAAHSAPMNLRLRVHLALQVPSSAKEEYSDGTAASKKPKCGLRVGPTMRTWETGQALVLDDAYDHEVWNETDEKRVLLLVDIWHPDVTQTERQEIVEMFAAAAEQRERNAAWEG